MRTIIKVSFFEVEMIGLMQNIRFLLVLFNKLARCSSQKGQRRWAYISTASLCVALVSRWFCFVKRLARLFCFTHETRIKLLVLLEPPRRTAIVWSHRRREELKRPWWTIKLSDAIHVHVYSLTSHERIINGLVISFTGRDARSHSLKIAPRTVETRRPQTPSTRCG